ncbi:probable terpene synthase 6 [Pistacia vera]|uniref:probable terpene synthase 6 n=1 Tax=Pistacia vera TaxID=55513 RepID=UPI001262F5F1|nr:probable terpene synthase 6 [Pistacia vera]
MGRTGMLSSASKSNDEAILAKIKDLLKVSLLEAEWFRKGFVPPFEERLNSELAPAGSISFYAATYFVGMGAVGIKEFEWLKSGPKIVRAAYIIGRLQCDIVSHEDEQKRGHVASTVECCMKEYDISKEETVEKFKRIMSDGWKDLNKECMKPTAVSSKVLITLVNSARVIEILYKEKDAVTCPEALKDYITKLIIHPIPI